jgi:plasmid stabilization system protein ParE
MNFNWIEVYKIKIEPEAQRDIQESINWYNSQKKGLGRQFLKTVKDEINILARNPKFQIRYDTVHCMPIKKYPFTVHYTINTELSQVIIRAIFHNSLNPKKWGKRK